MIPERIEKQIENIWRSSACDDILVAFIHLVQDGECDIPSNNHSIYPVNYFSHYADFLPDGEEEIHEDKK